MNFDQIAGYLCNGEPAEEALVGWGEELGEELADKKVSPIRVQKFLAALKKARLEEIAFLETDLAWAAARDAGMIPFRAMMERAIRKIEGIADREGRSDRAQQEAALKKLIDFVECVIVYQRKREEERERDERYGEAGLPAGDRQGDSPV